TRDEDCGKDDAGNTMPGSCDVSLAVGKRKCLSPISATNLYELATSNYLAGGGSGFRVLQRNTTQFDTKIQQRDALIDYMRQGKPCGYDKTFDNAEHLKPCSADDDCKDQGGGVGAFVCACPGGSDVQVN